MVDRDAVFPDAGKRLQDARALDQWIRPDPAQDGSTDALGTPLGQVGAGAASLARRALEHPPQARPAREIEEDEGVGALETSVTAFLAEEVPVEDPLVASDRGRKLA